jgi:acetolactate synthase-1/2/3 large subunit
MLKPTIGKGKYGSDLVVDLMQLYDIPYVALNPGSTFRGLHDSIVNYGGNKPEIVLAQHEKVAVQIAHGYAKATGRPMAAIAHDTVGLLQATNAIYYAYLDRVPVIVMGATGPMDTTRRRPHIDWIHTTVLQGQAVRDYVKWDRQPVNAQEVIDSFARAYRVAMQEPQGPVYLCYDAAFQEDPLDGEYPLPDPGKAGPGTRMQADPAALDQLAEWLLTAQQPVILAGYLGRHKPSFHRLVELAEATGAAVVDLHNRLNFPTAHPLNITAAAAGVLSAADLVLTLDVKDLYGPLTRLDRVARRTEYIIPRTCRIAEIGFRDVTISKWSDEFQQLVPVDLQIIADTSAALPDLLARVHSRLASDRPAQTRARERTEVITRFHTEARQRWQEEARRDWDVSPIAVPRLASEIWDAIKGTDWVLTANSLQGWTFKLWDFETPERHPGNSLGTATQIGISLGVALAYKGSGKLVVDIQPDGDLMYDVGALWIAAQMRIPMLAVMFNNRAYYNDWEHQLRIAEHRGRPVENASIGQAINDPPPDFAGLARSLGWYAEGPIEDPKQIAPALQRAIKEVQAGRPALVDTITQFD